jgi:NAD(P) transhydrogenase subunit alpha
LRNVMVEVEVAIRIAVLKETRPGERRVAMTPSVIERVAKLGAEVSVQSGAGEGAGFPDAAFKNVRFVADASQLVGSADVVLAVQPPAPETARAMKPGAILISFVFSEREPGLLVVLRERQITSFAMERTPRISRAQAMDALSSQASLAGYSAVLLAGAHLGRVFPRMTTAAGSLRPAAVLVMGLGVAGLQAIATAHRLGAIVEGYDVRPETQLEAASLGAKFVDTGVSAAGDGGYARELTSEEKEKAARVLTAHIQQADVIVTTAAVPGRPAPKLISKAQVDGMKAGAVIVDLAAEGGGNCEYSVPGETTRIGQVTIVAPLNVPSLLSEHTSQLYAMNLLNLLQVLIHDGELSPDWNDEVIAKMALTRAAPSGESLHPQAA